MKDSVTTKIAPPAEQREILLEVESAAAIEWGIGKVRLLWNSRRFLSKTVIIGFALSSLVAYILPAEYRSYTRLMPPDNQSNSALALLTARAANLSDGIAGFAGDLLGAKTTGALFIGILESRTVRDALVSKFALKKVYGESRSERAQKELAKHTSISEDRKSGIITIAVADDNRQRATAMAQEYVYELNRIVNQLSTSSANREREFLEERLVAVKQDLQSAEREFSQFASNSAAIDIKEQGKAMLEAAASVQGQLIAAQSQLQALKQIYTENSVRVQSAQARIAELRNQLDKLGGNRESENAKSDNDDSSYPTIRKLPLLGVTYADLYRKTKVQEAVFEALTREYEFAKVQEVKEIPSVKVLDPATLPEEKSFPPRLLITCVGSVIFAGLGMAWLFGQEVWRGMDADDPRKLLAGEVVSSLTKRFTSPWRNAPEGKKFKFLSRERG